MDSVTALKVASAMVGGTDALCRELKLSRQAVYKWRSTGIPVKRAVQIERLTEGRIKASELCPEVFGDESDGTK